MHCKTTALILLVLVSLAAIVSGCGGGGGGGTPPPGTDITPPAVSASVIAPAGGWTSAGGNATVRATVTDAGGVASVTGTLTASSTVNFTLANTTGSTYQAVVAVAPNPTAAAINYTVVVIARDTAGNTRSQTLTFSVPAAGPGTAPVVTASVALPAGWTWLAGDITINATATDADGIASVTAVVTPAIGSVTLDNTAGSAYSKVVTIPANVEATAVTYTVVVTAEDGDGETTSVTRTFSVPGIDIPPPPI